MENKTYTPKPIDAEGVSVPESIRELVELLAQNNHEVWASERISQGWTYGEKRDDVEKKHPCLVPYGELPEIEKEYDRNTALGVIKHILLLGYRIEKDDEQ